MKITNDRLVGVPFVRSPHQSGRMTPTLIILHDTAGRDLSSPGASVAWFTNPRAKVSAHLVIEGDGSITQMVDFDRIAWHAGRSSWRGRKGCNAFSIGIEIANPGKLAGDGTAWFGERYEGAQEARTELHGRGCWLPYSEPQIAAVRAVCEALMGSYPTIKAIARHCDVSPGRKVDVNPLYPLDELRAEVAAAIAVKAPDAWPLEIGDQSILVRNAQERLKALGYAPGPIDGIYGALTRKAMLAWEAENNRTTNGVVDQDEYAALMAPEAKELPVGPVAASAEKRAASAETGIKTVSAVASLAVVADASAEGTGVDLPQMAWDTSISVLDTAGEVVGKVTGLGLTIEPKFIIYGLLAGIAFAVWRWASQSRGER